MIYEPSRELTERYLFVQRFTGNGQPKRLILRDKIISEDEFSFQIEKTYLSSHRLLD